MSTIRKDFSKILQQKMKEKNISQVELARAIDVSDTTVYRYMRGLAIPRPLLMTRIIKVLNCSQDDFYDF